MVGYTLEQCWKILRHYFKNHSNVAECLRKLHFDFGRREATSAPCMFIILWKKWNKLASSSINQSVKSQKQCVHPLILLLWQKVCEAPSTSIQRRSQQLNISETSLRRILHKDLGMTPYKVQLVQELKPIDHPMRFLSAKWSATDLQKMPILAFEAHFDLGGYVDKQNCRVWGTENLHEYIGKLTHPKQVTVWCGFWYKGIIASWPSNRFSLR